MMNIGAKTVNCFTMKKTGTNTSLGQAYSHIGMRICLVLEGGGVWEINKKCHPLQKGDIILLSESQKRRFLSYSPEGITLGVFILERQAFSNIKHFLFFLTCIKEMGGVIRNNTLFKILTEAHKELSESSTASYELLSAFFTEFFIKAERLVCFEADVAVKIDKSMLNVLDYIDTHIAGEISLSQVASMYGFTESSFSRRFTKTFGVSFKKYVMTKKIERAIRLLDTTEHKVIDIAYECGFNSISGFYDTFRKVTGTTPNKFTYNV